jgi:autotransporter-associated beta strand protein
MDSNTTFDVNGATQQIAGLVDDGASGHQILLGNGTLTVGGAGNLSSSFSGAIHGTGGSLVKAGTGTLTLTGANDYTGDTIVDEGTLKITTAAPWLSDTAAVKIETSAKMNLDFEGSDTVGSVWLGGVNPSYGVA